MTNFMTLQPLHQQKRTIDLLFKNNIIHKQVINFMALPPPNPPVLCGRHKFMVPVNVLHYQIF